MRIGTSWPSGHGRRSWVSMSCLEWVLVGWLLLPLALCIVAVWALAWTVYGLIVGIDWAAEAAIAAVKRRRRRVV